MQKIFVLNRLDNGQSIAIVKTVAAAVTGAAAVVGAGHKRQDLSKTATEK